MTSVSQHDDSQLIHKPDPSKTCFGKITLSPDISSRNFLGCLIHYFMLSFIFVSIDSLQPMLLQQRFGVDRKHPENLRNCLVIAFDIIVKLLTAPIFGYLADRFGRRMIGAYGIVVIAVSMVIMPFCPNFELYVATRCFYAQGTQLISTIYTVGAIAISVIPLLADYVHNDSKGTCSAVLVFMSSLGALASAFLNFTLLKNLDSDHKIYIQYISAATISLVLGINRIIQTCLFYTLLCVKPGTTYYQSAKNNTEKRTFKKMIEIGKETLKVPEIALGYLSAFLARGDSILLSLYLVLWTYSMDESYDDAFTRASALSGVTYTVIMISCIVYGLLFQRKVSTQLLLIAMFTMAGLGTLSINFVQSYSSYLLYFSLMLLGLGMSGLLTASLYLVNTYAQPAHRGYITGIQTLTGILGITVQTFVGGILFEFWNRNGPFNLFGGICLLLIPVTIYMYWRQKKSCKNDELNSLIEDNS